MLISLGKEHDPDEDDLQSFLQIQDTEWTSLGTDSKGKSKGLGKGVLGKGSKGSKDGGKGKAREKTTLDDEQDLQKVLQAVKKARNMVNNTKADMEMALEKAASYLSPAGQQNAKELIDNLGKELSVLKEVLAQKDHDLDQLKQKLKDTAAMIRDAKNMANKLEGMGG